MRAIVVTEPGGPQSMRVQDVPEPVAGDGQVVVQVAAAGINRADLLQRQGYYPPPPGASDLLGLECSGRVVDTGPGVTGWRIGDRVCALLDGGGYAELVAVPQGQLMPVPDGVDLQTAAALPEAACTVYSNLAMVAPVRAGRWLLIHGGGSGIGTFAIQWARCIGAQVAVTAGSAEKLRRCGELGAQVLINYRDEDWVARIREATGGSGADVILDVVGAKYLTRNIEAMAPDGHLVVIGLQGGVKGELNLNTLLRKRGTVSATALRSSPADQKAEICRRVVRDVWPAVADGRVVPVVDRVLGLADAPAGHDLLAASGHFGKVLLAVADSVR